MREDASDSVDVDQTAFSAKVPAKDCAPAWLRRSEARDRRSRASQMGGLEAPRPLQGGLGPMLNHAIDDTEQNAKTHLEAGAGMDRVRVLAAVAAEDRAD